MSQPGDKRLPVRKRVRPVQLSQSLVVPTTALSVTLGDILLQNSTGQDRRHDGSPARTTGYVL